MQREQNVSMWWLVFGVAVVGAIAYWELRPTPSERAAMNTTTTTAAPEKSVEYQLATLHKGGYVTEGEYAEREDRVLVTQFRVLLDSLEAKCPEPRDRLGDMGLMGQKLLLEKGGIDEPLLDVFRAWDESVPSGGNVGPCADFIAAYVSLRVQ